MWTVDIHTVLLGMLAGLLIYEAWDTRQLFDGSGVRLCIFDGGAPHCSIRPPGTRAVERREQPPLTPWRDR